MDFPELTIAHLLLRLRPINRALASAVKRQQQQASALQRPDITAVCISDEQVDQLLGQVQVAEPGPHWSDRGGTATPDQAESEEEQELRETARRLERELPLDALSREFQLSPFEQEAIVICAAPEIDRAYDRIFAFVLDDLNRRTPNVELLCGLTAEGLAQAVRRRNCLDRESKLLRHGLLRPVGEAVSGLHQELALGTGLWHGLTGGIAHWRGYFGDPAEVRLQDALPCGYFPERDRLQHLAVELGGGTDLVAGFWGPREAGVDEAAKATAAAAGLLLRRLDLDNDQWGAVQESRCRQELATCDRIGAMLWLQTDSLTGSPNRAGRSAVARMLAESSVPILLSGRWAWRPLKILSQRRYLEVELKAPPPEVLRTRWRLAIPALHPEEAASYASRYRVGPEELHAIARLASSHCGPDGENGVNRACTLVTRRKSARFAQTLDARRGPSDLVLPEALHRQVLEVARFHLAWNRAGNEWRLGATAAGGHGIKTLFTGDSGTGKTLAAEVIAHQLGLSLTKVDLAQVVSKWVGETEKNLEGVFSEAEDSDTVLFFDEADSLFGKRGEVQHGSDRYANLEVGFLLQRLESYSGLVILASNLKDQIDPAFTRRFHIIIHFPRPTAAERGRLWRLSLNGSIPLAEAIDFTVLERLDLTGAGIVNAARTAALLALDSGVGAIEMAHLATAVSRQFRQEARVLSSEQLGPYASLIENAK